MSNNTLIRISTLTSVALLVLVIMTFSGKILGKWVAQQVFFDGNRVAIAIMRPGYRFFSVYEKVNSSSFLSRLTGYYALLDNNMMDEEFIFDRFRRERRPPIRRTLLWMLRYSRHPDKVLAFYAGVYKRCTPSQQREILRSLRFMGAGYYKKFREEREKKKN